MADTDPSVSSPETSVFIIGDNPRQIDNLLATLRTMGVEPRTFSCAEDARAALDAPRPEPAEKSAAGGMASGADGAARSASPAEGKNPWKAERRQRMADIVAAFAASRMLTEGAVEEMTRELTETAAAAMDTARAGVWLFETGGDCLANVDTYDAVTGRHTAGNILRRSEFRKEFELLKHSRYIDAHDALTDPRTAGFVDGYLKPHGITAVLDAVIRREDRNLGVVSFEHVNRSHRWHHHEITFACQLADQLALAIANREQRQLERRLQQLADRQQAILATVPEIIVEVNRDREYTFFNPAAADFFGVDAAGRDVTAFCSDPTAIDHTVAPLFSGDKTTIHAETRNRRRDGEQRLLAWVYRALTDRQGKITGVLGSARDITETRRREEALRLQAMVLDQIHDQVTVTDLDGVIAYVNKAQERALGRPREKMIGKPTVAVFGEDPAAGAGQREIIEETRRQGSWRGEVVNFNADGKQRIMDCRTRLVRDREGHPTALCGIATDVTDFRRMVDALRESEERFRTITEQSGDLIVVTGTDGVVGFASAAVREHLGCEPEDVCGRHFEEFIDEKDRRRAAEMFRKVLEQGATAHQLELALRHRDGSVRIGEINGTQFQCCGNEHGTILVIRDITERLRLQAEKELLEEQFRHAQKLESIGRLAGGVAHDLNNLLSPIIGYSELLQEDIGTTGSDGHREQLDQILQAALRARDLVRQLLAYGRRQTLKMRPVNLSRLIENFENLLRRSIPENIGIVIVTPTGKCPVQADIGQLEQVLLNLAVNTADAMPNGGTLTIETAPAELDESYAVRHPEVRPGPHIVLAVSDTGCGMDEKTRQQIFEPFFSTKGDLGTGLGLATVYGIVKQHEGSIWVYSEPGAGTTFKIYLPAAGGTDEKPAAAPATVPRPDAQGENILLVEDCAPMRQLALVALQRYGYNVTTATNGHEALQLLQTHPDPFHLLLTDVVMPEMNGRELYVRAADHQPEMKVLYMSGYTENIIAHHGVLDDEVQFIQKPFTVTGLAAQVRQVLDERK
ncbi:MAG: PAS domain S-box protein [Deltaproteobacteria bacterium]|nr:PAS domain S-box protein [Candidatus Anaeroferrophillacea bacterium]